MDRDDDDDAMDCRVEFRMTQEDLAAWRELARRDGRTLSSWIRRQCNLTKDAK